MSGKRSEVKVITRLDRRRHSVNGNAAWTVHFDDATSARTQSDADCAIGLDTAALRNVPVLVTFSRTGRVENVEPAPVYRVGDNDPTPDYDEGGEPCEHECYPVGLCSWTRGHRGQHVAGNSETVVGVAETSER